MFAETFEELGVREDAAPECADEGGTREGGWLRRETEEDLLEEILVVKRVRRRWPRTSIVVVEDLGFGAVQLCTTPQRLGIHT